MCGLVVRHYGDKVNYKLTSGTRTTGSLDFSYLTSVQLIDVEAQMLRNIIALSVLGSSETGAKSYRKEKRGRV